MSRLVFRVHAVRQMFKRGISEVDVRQAIVDGEVIEEYPDDLPYPSRLVLGWLGSQSLHVVVSENRATHEVIVVTVYEPDPAFWDRGFRRRKKR